MASRQPRDNEDPDKTPDAAALQAEHRALKRQTLALQREHEELHVRGGSRAEHQEHRRRLRHKLKELEEHVERLKNLRKSTG